MIPLKIRIKNFLSYGNQLQKIDFKDYQLICLSGKNGNGKSALLDAMTWALWGVARKTTGTIKADAGLIHLGQSQMMVSLEFKFNGSVYNVRREYTKTFGKPLVILDFELFDESKDRFMSLTEKTIKKTQEKIENLIGIDFETFSNTAFLRQGQANEFSKKSPKERKQILANILGFDKYEKLKQLASEKAKHLLNKELLLNSILQSSNGEIKKEQEIKEENENALKKLKKINYDLNKRQKEILNLEKENLILQEKKKTSLILEKEIEEFKRLFRSKESDCMILVSKWKIAHHKSLKQESLNDLESLKNDLLAKNKVLLSFQQENLNFQEELLKNKTAYQKEENLIHGRLESEVYSIKLDLEKELLNKNQLEILSEQKDKIIIKLENIIENQKKEKLKFEEKLRGKDSFFANLEKAKMQFDKRRAYYQVLVQKGNFLKVQIDDLSQKYKTLKMNESPACPLCLQVLTLSRKKFLVNKFKISDRFFVNKMNRVSSLLKKLKKILFDQHKELQNMLEMEDEYKKILIQKNELLKSIDITNQELKKETKLFEGLSLKIKEAVLKARIIQNNLSEKEKELKIGVESNLKLKRMRSLVEKLEKSLSKTRYDKTVHEKLQNEIQDVENRCQLARGLGDELVKQRERRHQISLYFSQLKEIKKQLKDRIQKNKELSLDKDFVKELKQKIEVGKIEVENALKDKDNLLQKLGRLKNELFRIKTLKIEYQKKEKEIKTLHEDIQYYNFLAKTFGYDGLQALLIEQAIPEIEQEANKILSKLTENQTQIFFESLRDLKKGGVKETLDIQISDSIGMRPYEMFSGGEAFRVDFAIRIAISKLLARRSGTPLQTLIIDEGFGSQDEEGLSRLMDSIYAIQDDFAKIIVVSHLSAFKDNFPVHFMVEKTSSGSFINVEERG